MSLPSHASSIDPSAAESCLVTIYGPRWAALPARQGRPTIGRGPDNDIVFDMDNVSRRTPRVFRSATTASIEDLQSTNGSYVNDVQVKSKSRLRDADFLEDRRRDLQVPRRAPASRRATTKRSTR